MEKTERNLLECNRCNYKWFQKGLTKPKYCAGCNSPYYDKPRIRPIREANNRAIS